MTERSALVRLRLDATQYKAEALTSGEKTEALDRKVEALERDLKKLPPDAVAAAAGLKLLGTEASSTDRKLRDLDTNRVSIFQRIRAQMPGLGQASGEDFAGGMTSGLEEASTPWAGIIAGAFVTPPAIGLYAAVGATVGAVLSAGIGAAFTAGGLFAALKSPLGQQAWADLKGQAADVFETSAESFIGPLRLGFSDLTADLRGLRPELSSTFEALAPQIRPLIDAVGSFVTQMLPGIEQAVLAARPLLDTFNKWLPVFGKDIGQMFANIAGGTQGANHAFMGMLMTIDMTVKFIGTSIRWLEDTFQNLGHFVLHTFAAIADAADSSLNWIPGLGSQLRQARDQVNQWAQTWDQGGKSMSGAAGSADMLDNAFVGLGTSTRDAAGALSDFLKVLDTANAAAASSRANFTISLDDLSKSIQQWGRSFDPNTVAGAHNMIVLLQSIANANKDAQDVLAKTGSAKAAADAYQADIDKLNLLLRQAGLTKAAIADLDAQFASAQAVKQYVIKLDISPSAGFAARTAQNVALHQAQGGIVSFANAGIFSDRNGALIQFAEPGTGMEGFVPQRGISHARAGSILAPMAGWHGYGVVDWSKSRSAGGSSGGGPAIIVQLIDPQTGQVTRQAMIKDANNRGVPQSAIAAAYP